MGKKAEREKQVEADTKVAMVKIEEAARKQFEKDQQAAEAAVGKWLYKPETGYYYNDVQRWGGGWGGAHAGLCCAVVRHCSAWRAVCTYAGGCCQSCVRCLPAAAHSSTIVKAHTITSCAMHIIQARPACCAAGGTMTTRPSGTMGGSPRHGHSSQASVMQPSLRTARRREGQQHWRSSLQRARQGQQGQQWGHQQPAAQQQQQEAQGPK